MLDFILPAAVITGVTTETFTPVLEEILGLIPVLLPAVVGFLAFRKGWSFLKGEVASA